MAGKIKGLTVVINGDTTSFSKAVAKARASMKDLKNELKDVDRALRLDPTSFSLIAQKQQLLASSLGQSRQKLNDLRLAAQAYHDYVGQRSEKDVANYRKLQTEIALTESEVKRLESQAVKFGTAASTSTLQAKAQYDQLGNTLMNVAKHLALISASSAVIGGLSIKAAMDFESSFAGVYKTVDATTAEFNELSDAIREMALVKPIDVNDINYAAELGGQLGIAVENLEQFASVIADLDVATNLDLEDASLKLAQFANIANIGETNFDRLGATIVDLGNNSATTETKIMNMAMRIAGSGSNIGLSAQEVLALATALSSVGIEAEMGGNAISTIMNRIDKDVALNTDTLKVWADTAGMSVQEFAAAWDNSDTVMDAMQAVIDGMGRYRDEGGNLNTLLADMNISYMRQVDTMQRLSRTGDIVNEMVDIANNAWDENIALTREANRRYETTANQLQLVKNNINECGIQLGNIMLPSVRKVTDGMVDLLQGFQSLDVSTKENIVDLMLLSTAAAPTALALALMSKGVSKLIGLYASAKTQMMLWTTGMVTANGAIDKNAAAAARAASAASAMSTAMNMAKIAAGVLAVAGVAVLASEFSKAVKHEENFKKATDGLRKSMESMDDTTKSTVDAINSMSTEPAQRSYYELKESIEATIESQAALTDSLNEQWGDLNANSYAVESYVAIIEELTNKYDENGNKVHLNAEEQAKLSAAVAGLNDACGTSYEIISATTGILSASTEEIKKNADAWILNAEAQALSEMMAEAKKEEFQLVKNQTDALALYNAELAYYNELQRNGYVMTDADRGYLDGLLADYTRATSLLEAHADSYSYLVEKYGENQEALEAMAPAYDRMLAHVTAFGDGLKTVFDEAKVSQDEFIGKITEVGVAAEDFNTLSEEQLKILIENYDGTYESIAKLMDQFIADNYNGGESSGQAFSDGLDASQAEVIRSAAGIYGLTVDQFAGLANALGYEGVDAVLQFASGIQSGEDETSWAASVIAVAAKGVANGNSWQWGYDLVQNFANGITVGKELARLAATAVGSVVKSILGHSIAEEGPLHNYGKGEIEWGEHLVQNLIQGMENEEAALRAKAASLGDIVAGELGPRSAESILNGLTEHTSSSAMKTLGGCGFGSLDNKNPQLSKDDIRTAMFAAMSEAFAYQGDIVVRVGEREMARVVRKHV